jgi:hypothetical protein
LLRIFAENFSVFDENISVYARRCYVGLNSLKSLNLTKVYPNNSGSPIILNNKCHNSYS